MECLKVVFQLGREAQVRKFPAQLASVEGVWKVVQIESCVHLHRSGNLSQRPI
jgi:hypothetical protein